MHLLPRFLANDHPVAASFRGKPFNTDPKAFSRLTTHSPLYNPPQEQNRPVYVQTVEPRPDRQPLYPIPDGRHFVTVD